MGNFITSYVHSALEMILNLSVTRRRILILGLDCAGKTTLLYQFKLSQVVDTIATVGFNVESFKYKSITFTAWDIGGSAGLRPMWRYYYEDTAALIYVVDSCDRNRIEEAGEELHRVLENDELRGCKVLVYANKQDRADCMSVLEIYEKLRLDRLANHPHNVVKMSIITGDGVYEGIEWLTNALTSKT